MNYEITILTLPAAIPVGTTGASRNTPFATTDQTKPLDLSGGTIKTLHVSDDDARLDGIYGAKTYGSGVDLNQVVAQDITIGTGSSSQTLLAGQPFGFDYTGRMYSIENGKVVAAYEIAFPRIPGSGLIGDIVGGKFSMMILPVPYTASDGTVIAPAPFDPAKTYYFQGSKDYNSADYSVDYYAVDCFASGTLIDTAKGPRPVETLKSGDLVMTRDDGPQPLVWAGKCHVDAARLDLQPNLRPIRIAAGALAPGCPARDLTLSPQHRVLIRSDIALRMFDRSEVLVAVKHLVGLPGIEVQAPADGVSYHHLLFADHQVLRSEGAWTESLFLGPQALKGLDPAARREVMALYPELAKPELAEAEGTPEPARRLLTGREGRKLAERHGRNRKPLVQAHSSTDRREGCLLPV